jgi:hypothetical protein
LRTPLSLTSRTSTVEATANQIAATRSGLSASPSDIKRVRLFIIFGGCRTLLGLAGKRPFAGQPLAQACSRKVLT